MANRKQNQGELGKISHWVHDGKQERRIMTAIWKPSHKDFGRYWIQFLDEEIKEGNKRKENNWLFNNLSSSYQQFWDTDIER